MTSWDRCDTKDPMLQALIVFVTVLALNTAARSETTKMGPSTCGDATSLPLGSLGPHAEQRDLLFKQAVACVRERKPRRAITLLSTLIKDDPKDATAYLNRGSVQATIGEAGLAMSDLDTAIRLDPSAMEAWYDRGTILMHMHRYERAVADFTEAIRLKPDLALAHCNRGFSKFMLGRYDDAFADYTRGIGLDPIRMSFCYFNRGNLHLIVGEYQKAVEDLTKAIGHRTPKAVVLSRRAQAYEGLSQRDRALEDFRAALQLDPKLDSAREGIDRLRAADGAQRPKAHRGVQ
jgi:tetratricopeptide (TPR) repeat protein